MTTFLFILGVVYAVAMTIFLISENRRPQATLAWMLVFIFAPGLGAAMYIFFGRDTKAFSKQSKLLKQDLEPHARPLLSPLIDRQDAIIAQFEGNSIAHRKLLTLVRQNSRSALLLRNRAEILQDASTFYPRMMEDMRAAKRSIHHQYFIWRTDPFTEALYELMAEKVKHGVEVRLLFDPLGSQSRGRRAYFRKLRKAGIRVAPTSPLWWLHTISYRNHRKITVIDGMIGYTGGMNIGEEHLTGGKGFDAWRDTQLRVAGDAAQLLQSVFAVDWYNAVRENLFTEAQFPFERTCVESDCEDPVQILTSGPDAKWAAIQQLYTTMIVAAEKRVFIQSPYFILDASLAEALRVAAMSGIDVRVMLSARESGNPLPTWAGNTFIADIVRAGVRVFLYQKGYLHAKTISIDSKICSIGSANIDIRSFTINYELNSVLYSDRLASELERAFELDQVNCTEFDAAAYRDLNPLVRFRDSVARLFSPLL